MPVNNPKVLAVIPARGGSKGVPRKNIRMVGGKPLIAYTIDAALAVKNRLHRLIVSTDDAEIAAMAQDYGAEVPFMRPVDLGGDKVPMVPVLKHAIQTIEELDGIKLEWVLLLQPTCPFRAPEDILAALELAAAGGCDSVISVVRVLAHHPILMKKIENDRLLPFMIEEIEGTRRQDYNPPAYMRNGSIYLTRRDNLMNNNSIWGKVIRPYIMPEERSVNVDSEMDMKLVEYMLQDRQQRAGQG
ncbi:MAG: acylneuraminate cytidylyltransferase family protein [Chloroflexi bacterium]|nr:MAG: acylneuraminate cytidylyltransferase family protein [Chloroflexota bacterium]